MILPLASAADAWDRVRDSPAQGPVLVFCAAPDPDALAAARTLTALLRADLVRYELHPVAGYAQLRAAFDALARGAPPVVPRAVLCINCGARVDLAALLGLANNPDTDGADGDRDREPLERAREGAHSSAVEEELAQLNLFVLDSHRPYHLRNVSSERVCVFDDNIEDFDASALPLDVGWEDEWGNVRDLSDISSSEDEDDGRGKISTRGEDKDEREDDSDRSNDGDTSGDSDDRSDASEEEDSDSDKDRSEKHPEGESVSDAESPENIAVRDRSGARRADWGRARQRPRRRRRADDDISEEEDTEPDPSDIDEQAGRGDDIPPTIAEVPQRKRTRSGANLQSPRRGPQKRRHPSKRNRRERRHRRRRRRQLDGPEAEERRVLQEYYAAAQTGMSSACIAHNIALMLRRASVDTLWAAIVGVTHQYLAVAVHPSVYAEAVEYCRSQVASLATVELNAQGNVQDGPVHNSGYTQTLADDKASQIFSSIEYRLDLVRHWTLHDSLLYSTYTITRLAAWRQTGRRRLMELLATLGIPLKESKQKWCYMKAEFKAALDDRLSLSVRRFDLGKDIQYDSFIRVLPGHKGKVSAADMVYGLSALLELDGVTLGSSVEKARSSSPSSLDLAIERRFWRAYDALDVQSPNNLSHGFDLAIMSQKLAAEIGGEVIERRKFVPSGPFRYVFLRDVQCKELFSHPLLLKRLALFLMDAVTRQAGRSKPFLVMAPNPTRNIWLAVAAISTGASNNFGHRFRRAAEQNGCQITFAGFDSAVCEIPDGQETEFIRFLHDVMI